MQGPNPHIKHPMPMHKRVGFLKPLVDADALLAALDAGRLAGAGLDVFDPEPLPGSSRLRDHPLIVATPHMASSTREGRERMETMAVARVLSFFDGHRPPDVVNPAVYDAPGRLRPPTPGAAA